MVRSSQVRPQIASRKLTVTTLAAAISIANGSAQAQSVEATSAAIRGRAPVVTIQGITNEDVPGQAPKTGHHLHVDATVTDPDNDAITDTRYEWRRDAATVGTGTDYTTTADDAGKTLTVQVTADTDPAITDPTEGTASESVAVTANSKPKAEDVTVMGTTSVGQIMTGLFRYTDVDNDPEGEHAFQWYRADDATGTNAVPIAEATHQIYMLTNDDQGKFILFGVKPRSRTGDPNTGDEVRKSFATAVLGTGPEARNLQLTGDAKWGGTLTASFAYHDDQDDPEGVHEIRWFRATTPTGEPRGTEIASARDQKSYVVQSGDMGQFIVVEVVPKSASGQPNSGTAEAVVSEKINSVPTATPTIDGSLRVGQLLSGTVGYQDAENDPPAAHNYRWYRADNAAGDNEQEIPGAQASSYTVVAGDVGKHIVFAVRPRSTTGSFPGVWTRAISASPVNENAPTANPSITFTGALAVGKQLNGNVGFEDLDNDPEGVHEFKWYRADNAAGTAGRVEVATTQNYTTQASDQGKYLVFEVTPKATTGNPASGVAAFAVTTGTVPGTAPFVEEGSVSIAGVWRVGEELTGNYTYKDDENDPQDEAATQFAWYISDQDGANPQVITEATARKFKLRPQDQGGANRTVWFRVKNVKSTTGTPNERFPNPAHQWQSIRVGEILGSAPTAAPTVTFIGPLGVGTVLTANTGYDDLDNDPQSGTSYQWCEYDAAGTNLLGCAIASTTNTWTVIAGNVGRRLSVKVIPRSSSGNPTTGDTFESVKTDVVPGREPKAQSASVGVSPAGTLKTGTILTANYTFTDADNDDELGTAFQWYRKTGSTIDEIANATDRTYVLNGADQGDHSIGVRITPKSATGTPDTGAPVTAETADKFLGTQPVVTNLRIEGTRATVGQTVEVKYDFVDAEDDADTSTFNWCRRNVFCGLGSGKTYVLQASDVGHRLGIVMSPRTATGTPNSAPNVEWSEWPAVGTIQNEAAPTATAVSISGTPQVGNELTGSYTYQDVNNDDQGATTMQWYTATDAAGTMRTAITGATTDKFTVRSEDQGKYFVFEVTPRSIEGVPQVDGTSVRAVSARTSSAPVASAASVTVEGGGGMKTGSTLTANYTFTDADNDNELGTMFQWYRKAGSTIDEIANATGRTYVLTGADQGDHYIGVRITPKSATGTPDTGAPVTAETADKFLGAKPLIDNLMIEGRPTVGSIVEFKYDFTDANNDIEDGTIYEWCRINVACSVAATKTYTLQAADVGKNMNGYVTPKTSGGNPNSGDAKTAPQFPAIGTIQNEAAPTATVSISGTAQVGNELTGSNTYNDINNDAQGATTRQWYTAIDSAGTDRTEITGATTNKFTVRSQDQGKWIVYEVTPRSVSGVPNVDGTPMRAVTIRVNSAPTANPTISYTGEMKVGTVLTANANFNDVDNDAQSGTTYQWCSYNSGGTLLGCAAPSTGNTWTVQASNIGNFLSVRVVPKSGTGNPNTGAMAESENTAIETVGVTLSISDNGVARYTGSTTYTGSGSPGAHGYEWYSSTSASGTPRSPIADTTGLTAYEALDAHNGRYLVLEVTPRSSNGVVGSPVTAVAAHTQWVSDRDYGIEAYQPRTTDAIAVTGAGNASSSSRVQIRVYSSGSTNTDKLKFTLIAPDGTQYVVKAPGTGFSTTLDAIYTVNLSSEARSGQWRLRIDNDFDTRGTLVYWGMAL